MNINFNKITYGNVKAICAPVGEPEEDATRLAVFSKWFFGDPNNIGFYYIRNKIPPFHLDIYKALASEPMYYYITAPRGYAKSTIVQLVYVVYRIVYDLDKHILLIEKVDKPDARAVLRRIKRALTSNRKIIKVFGDLKPTRKQRMFDGYMWGSHEIKTNTNIYIRSVGMGGSVRGGIEDEYRYTLILPNDMQGIKHKQEPQTLLNHIEFYERDVEPAIDPEFGKIRPVGNMLCPGCVMESIVNDSKYDGIDIGALVDKDGNRDINGTSIWEDRFPTEKVHKERDSYEVRGKLHVFLAEKMNIIQDEQKVNFAGYRYYNGELIYRYGQNILQTDIFPDIDIPVYTYRCIDPAYGDVEKNDPRAAVTIAVGMFPGKTFDGKDMWIPGIFVIDYKYDLSNPALLINEAIDDHPRFHYRGIIIEANGPQRIYQYLGIAQLQASEYIFKNPVNFICVEHQSEEKFSRIYNDLQPKCSLGQFFIKPEHKELKSELELFRANPRGIHLLDAIQLGLSRIDVCRDKVKRFDDTVYKKIKAEQNIELLTGSYNNALNIFEQIGMR